MSEELKAERSKLKRAVTTQTKIVKRLVAERDLKGLPDQLIKLKGCFRSFDLIHAELAVQEEDESLIEVNDRYFDEVQDTYIAV